MTVDSLEKLSAAFEEWRTRKKHVREKMPEELLRRARRAVQAYGYRRVARATKVDRRRLNGARVPVAAEGGGRSPVATPAYSRVEWVGPATSARPFAELETPSGVKLRLYTPTRVSTPGPTRLEHRPSGAIRADRLAPGSAVGSSSGEGQGSIVGRPTRRRWESHVQ